MSRRKELSTTSAGVPWEDVPEHALADVEWMDGRHGPGEDKASVEEFPVSSSTLLPPLCGSIMKYVIEIYQLLMTDLAV